MENKHKVWILYLVFLLTLIAVFFYLGHFFMAFTHEVSHKEIWKDYDIDSSINTKAGLNWITQPSGSLEDLKEKCDDTCKLAQNQTELVGYQLAGFYAGIWMLFLSYVFFEIFFKDFLKLRWRK